MVVPSIVPPLMSAVVATRLLRFMLLVPIEPTVVPPAAIPMTSGERL